MSVTVEKLAGGKAKLVFDVELTAFEEACKKAYNQKKSRIQIPGFRKGKVTYAMACKVFGKAYFYDDALNIVLPDAYKAAVEESGVEVMSRPQVDLDTFEPDKEIKITATVAVKPEVKLGEYKGLKKDQEPVAVTDEDVEKEVETVAKRNARKIEVTDRAAAMGDTANIDYLGSVDGVPFDGGKGEGYDLKLGSGSFIPGFEEQVAGHSAGEEFDVNVTFPENYHSAELAGKEAVFACKINKVTAEELPLVDAEYVKEISEFDTVEAYKEDVRKTLTERREKLALDELKNKLIEKVTSEAEMELAEEAVMDKCDEMIQEFAQNLSYQGMDIEQYMKMSGTDINKLREEVKPEAERRLKENLTMEAIAKAEGLEVTEEDMENEYNDLSKAYGMDVETIKGYMSANIEMMKADMLIRKAVNFVVENAVD
ncbi:MAG: trigger factor [Lachnospiraceae bacterium]|nr:trigger factor [Lachnospiraceae bacterium]